MTGPEQRHDASPGDAGTDARARRARDGLAGRADVLGGPVTLSGDDQGVGGDGIDDRAFEPGPISGHQHDLENAEPRTDSATTVHSAANLPTGGA